MFSICSSAAIFTAVFLLTVAVDGTLRVDWSVATSLSDVALLGSTRTGLARRLILTAPLGVLDFSKVPIKFLISLLQPGPAETLADR